MVGASFFQIGNCATTVCTISARICDQLNKLEFTEYLSYDFLIYKNGLPFAFIECQGEQHYNPVDFFGGEEQFYVQQSHDNLKRAYAEVLGIPLIEIPYTVDKYHLVNELLKSYDI